MTPKGATRKAQLDIARPHFLKCYDCKLKIRCPKFEENVDQIKVEPLEDEIEYKEEKINMKLVKEFISCLSVEGKSEILAVILNSESDSIWEDQKKGACNISQSTVQTITGVNADEWYECRHPLIKTIAEELSKVSYLLFQHLLASI